MFQVISGNLEEENVKDIEENEDYAKDITKDLQLSTVISNGIIKMVQIKDNFSNDIVRKIVEDDIRIFVEEV